MTATHANAAPQRKTLASQLDRLDSILDALSDGLNEAVAFAVEQATGTAVRGAVQAALTEVLTNPLVLARLRDALAPPAPLARAAPVAPVVAASPAAPEPGRLRTHFERAQTWAKGCACRTR